MRRILAAAVLVSIPALAFGCAETGAAPAEPMLQVAMSQASAPASSHNAVTFAAALRGAAEVPPVQTAATGMAGFRVTPNQNGIAFQVLLGRINNVSMIHIHQGAAGTNGPVVAWLYPAGPPPVVIPGEFNGVIAEGMLTSANLVGPLQGQPLSALITEIRAGNTYVNVHTQQNPAGEIRGQIGRLEVLD
jgi:hypothetical protein